MVKPQPASGGSTCCTTCRQPCSIVTVVCPAKERMNINYLQLGQLPNLPQRATIVAVATRLWTDESVVALWVGGSLARGAGDQYSDVDFRVAVEPEHFTSWGSPPFSQIFAGTSVVGQIYIPFGNDALLHHLVLGNAEIFDFFVQSTSRRPTEEPLLILGCRSEEFARQLNASNVVLEVDRKEASSDLVHDLLLNHSPR